jgi:hypothetical protein
MSAFICDTDTFKALAIFAATRQHGSWRVDPRYVKGLDSPEYALRGIANLCADELATLYADTLYRENVRSVSYRYPNSGRDDLPGPIADAGFVDVTNRDLCNGGYISIKAVSVLKSCDCLEYQSCETPDYKQSVAYALLSAIRRAAIRSLPGYDDAPWGFELPARKAA